MKFLKKEFYNSTLLICVFAFSIMHFSAVAQQQNLPLNTEYSNWVEKAIFAQKNYGFTSVKPLVSSTIGYDTLLIANNAKEYKLKQRKWLGRKLLSDNFIVIDTADLYLTIDPLLHLEKGFDKVTPDSNLYRNTRGIQVKGNVTQKFSFETSFYENQAFLPLYLDSFVRKYEVAPGSGRVKTFKTTGFDYAMSSGHFTYSPNNKFFIQAGHGKHFVGNGYRSMLLSDNSFNYPYLKLSYQRKKFYYSTIFASFQVVQNGRITLTSLNEGIFRKKTGSFQMLGYKPHNNVELMLFQGVIWQARTPNFPKFNFNALNPIIGINAMSNGWQSRNNLLMGLNANIKIHKSVIAYTQVALDDAELFKNTIHNKNAKQIGIKLLEPLGVKHLYMQAEYNTARPYTYAHKKETQSYTHYNQPLASPLGANYKEVVLLLNYNVKRIYIQLKYNNIQYGSDTIGSYNAGHEVLNSDNSAIYNDQVNYKMLQGIKNNVIYKEARVSFLLNPATNLNVFAGATFRDLKNQYVSSPTRYFYLGIRTSLTNTYFDF